MGLLSFLDRGRHAGLIQQLSAQIAHRCHAPVWATVRRRATAMRLTEARGYVRARAAQMVASEVAAALSSRPQVGRDVEAELVTRTTDGVVSLVFRDLLNLPPCTLPSRHVA